VQVISHLASLLKEFIRGILASELKLGYTSLRMLKTQEQDVCLLCWV